MQTDAFLADLQARVMKNPGIGIRPLAREMGVAPSTMKMALDDTVVKPWITRVVNGKPYVFQQDSAPCHTASKTIKWLPANFNAFIAPNVCAQLPGS